MGLLVICLMLAIFVWCPKKVWPYFVQIGAVLLMAIYTGSVIWAITTILCLANALSFAIKKKSLGTYILAR